MVKVDQWVLVDNSLQDRRNALTTNQLFQGAEATLGFPPVSNLKSIRTGIIPSGYVNIAIENGHRNSEFSHEKWWIFP